MTRGWNVKEELRSSEGDTTSKAKHVNKIEFTIRLDVVNR